MLMFELSQSSPFLPHHIFHPHIDEEDQEKIIAMEIKKAEELFTQEEVAQLKMNFNTFSKENKMAKRKLLDYFGLLDLDHTNFAI